MSRLLLKLSGEALAGANGEIYNASFVDEVAALAEKLGVKITMTSSIPVEEASETVKKYL